MRNERLRIWVLSVLILFAWCVPVGGLLIYSYAAVAEDRNYGLSFASAIFFGLPLVWASRLLKSPVLWLLSGIMFGIGLLAPWIPLNTRHRFFIQANFVRPGMTVEEVRRTMAGFSEAKSEPEPPFDQALNWQWDRYGASSLDCLGVEFLNGVAADVFIGTE